VCRGPMIAPALTPPMSKLCGSMPSFLITNVIVPCGTGFCDSVKEYSFMDTFTVVAGPVTVVVVLVVPPVVVVDVDVEIGFAATLKVPFMPSAPLPLTVHRNAMWLFLPNLTVIVCDWPGLSSLVFFPAILKSWPILPLLTTLKATVPVFGRLDFESLIFHSDSVTVIFVTVADAFPGTAWPVPARRPPIRAATPRARVPRTPSTRRIVFRNPLRFVVSDSAVLDVRGRLTRRRPT